MKINEEGMVNKQKGMEKAGERLWKKEGGKGLLMKG